MATKTIYISSWDGNIRLNTDNEANIAHASYKSTYEIYFTKATPEAVEIQCQHANLNQLDGHLHIYQKLHADLDFVEITNADALPEPIPTPLDSAAGNFTNFLWQFTGYGLKIVIDGTATVGTVKLALGIRNE